jgi:hypothetical protein
LALVFVAIVALMSLKVDKRSAVSAAVDPPRASADVSGLERSSSSGELSLTLGDHCSRRTSWNGPAFPTLPFVKPEPQVYADSCVPWGFDHEVYDPEQLRHDPSNAGPERVDLLAARGPLPLSGDPHASTGSSPGLLVLEVLKQGRTGAVRGLARITNKDAGGVERADAHGIRVTRLGRRW